MLCKYGVKNERLKSPHCDIDIDIIELLELIYMCQKFNACCQNYGEH